MRYIKLFLTLLVSVLLIGTVSANAGDGVPGQPFQNQQNQIDDHESRITNLEQQTSTAGPKVYNAEGSFLGFLLGHRSTYVQIFIPGLGAMDIDKMDGYIFGGIWSIYFEKDDCTGLAYAKTYSQLYIDRITVSFTNSGERYWTILADQVSASPLSYLDVTGCNSCSETDVFQLAIEILANQIPFTFPVERPFIYQ